MIIHVTNFLWTMHTKNQQPKLPQANTIFFFLPYLIFEFFSCGHGFQLGTLEILGL
jgi:hypothetical protein